MSNAMNAIVFVLRFSFFIRLWYFNDVFHYYYDYICCFFSLSLIQIPIDSSGVVSLYLSVCLYLYLRVLFCPYFLCFALALIYLALGSVWWVRATVHPLICGLFLKKQFYFRGLCTENAVRLLPFHCHY